MSTKALIKHLDSPLRILSFSINDLLGYLTPFFIGALFDSLLILPLCGFIIIYFIKKMLRRLPRFYLIRYMYWALPTQQFNKNMRASWPASSKRLWVK